MYKYRLTDSDVELLITISNSDSDVIFKLTDKLTRLVRLMNDEIVTQEFLYLKQMPLYPFFDLVLPNTLQESS